jgi:hypothetical protein
MLHFYKKNHRIGLDVDEVLADFLGGFSEHFKIDYTNVKHFYFSYLTQGRLDTLPEDFWLNLKPKVDGSNLPFLPTCYISRREFDISVTEKWIEKVGLPCMPVIHVNGSKVDACRRMNLDTYIDDSISNFMDLNAAGIPTLLLDCSHNQQYKVDPYRINSICDVPSKIIEFGW